MDEMNKKDSGRVGGVLVRLCPDGLPVDSTKEETEGTFFVFTEGIPEKVRDYFWGQDYGMARLPRRKYPRETIEIWIHPTCRLGRPFMRKAEFYGIPLTGCGRFTR